MAEFLLWSRRIRKFDGSLDFDLAEYSALRFGRAASGRLGKSIPAISEVILTEGSNATAEKDLGQLRASEAGSGFESLHPTRTADACARITAEDRFAISEPVPAALTRRCPRSFLPLALLALSG
jgi:hypothetical protein